VVFVFKNYLSYEKFIFFVCNYFFQSSFAISGSQISVSNGTGSKFYIGTNCAIGPSASYLVLNIKNTSSTDTLASLQVKLTGISSTTSGFKLLAPIADSTLSISRINPEKSGSANFYIQYPCVDAATVKFYYEISDTGSGTYIDSVEMTTSEIAAAAAGGDIQSQVVVGLDALGILIADTVTHLFGNYNGGVLMIQPNGDTLFKANKVQLIGSKILSSAFNACGVPVDTTNVYYFNNASGCGAGSGNTVKVVYYYVNSLYNDSTYFFPFSAMKSGGPIKYSSNYSTQSTSFSTTSSANSISMTKVASCGICGAGDTLTYTVTISNSASDSVMVDEVIDILPSGYKFIDIEAGSDINASNTSVTPVNGSTGTLSFMGKVPSATFPYRSYIIAGNSSIELKYRAKAKPSTSNDLDSNTVMAKIGDYYLDTALAVTCAGCATLPVRLVSFQAKEQEKGAVLSWKTSMEDQNSHFNIYRITNSGSPLYIGNVSGAGNSTQIIEYTFFDQFLPRGNNLKIKYILEQVGFDGDSEMYFARLFLSTESVLKLQVYPNPFRDVVYLQLNNQEDDWGIEIINSQGKICKTYVSNQFGTASYIALSTSSLSSGIYTIRYKCEGKVEHFTIAKQ
jgi:uncharacterized repeat protein (TIGR01451 family)